MSTGNPYCAWQPEELVDSHYHEEACMLARAEGESDEKWPKPKDGFKRLWKIYDEKTGLRAAMFRVQKANDQTEIIFAFAGTKDQKASSWVDNFYTAWGLVSREMLQAAEIGDAIRRMLIGRRPTKEQRESFPGLEEAWEKGMSGEGSTFSFTGHSKGACCATVAMMVAALAEEESLPHPNAHLGRCYFYNPQALGIGVQRMVVRARRLLREGNEEDWTNLRDDLWKIREHMLKGKHTKHTPKNVWETWMIPVLMMQRVKKKLKKSQINMDCISRCAAIQLRG